MKMKKILAIRVNTTMNCLTMIPIILNSIEMAMTQMKSLVTKKGRH